MKTHLIALGVATAASLLGAQAQAQDDLAKELKDCSSVADDQARLSCFDGIALSLDERAERQALESKQALKAATEIAEGNFGLPTREYTAEIEAKKNVEPETQALLKAAQTPDQIDAAVTKVERSRSGKLIIFLDNEQIWAETSASRFRGKPKIGETAVIQKKGLGWFRIEFSDTYGIMAARRVK